MIRETQNPGIKKIIKKIENDEKLKKLESLIGENLDDMMDVEIPNGEKLETGKENL